MRDLRGIVCLYYLARVYLVAGVALLKIPRSMARRYSDVGSKLVETCGGGNLKWNSRALLADPEEQSNRKAGRM